MKFERQTIITKFIEETDISMEDDFVQTEHDTKVEEFIDTIMAENNAILSVTDFSMNGYFMTTVNYLNNSGIVEPVKSPLHIKL